MYKRDLYGKPEAPAVQEELWQTTISPFAGKFDGGYASVGYNFTFSLK